MLADLEGCTLYWLEADAPDIRSIALDARAPAFVLGDHLGFSEAVRGELSRLHALPMSVGPVELYT